jgi:protease I
MHKPLLGEKIAVLVANGFEEKDLTELQRALLPYGATMRIISMDHGLVNSWNEGGWGLNFAADSALSAALAADFSMLVVPGGRRSIEKLKLTAHTRRFLNGFLDFRKPIVMFGDAVELLGFTEKAAGRTVTGPESAREALNKAGAVWKEEAFVIDGQLMTTAGGQTDAKNAADFLLQAYTMVEAA